MFHGLLSAIHSTLMLIDLNNSSFRKNSLPKDYLMYETEESMNLRHKAELLELQTAHLVQRKALLDRRQACLRSTISLPYDFHQSDHEEFHKAQSHLGEDVISFSAISSGNLNWLLV